VLDLPIDQATLGPVTHAAVARLLAEVHHGSRQSFELSHRTLREMTEADSPENILIVECCLEEVKGMLTWPPSAGVHIRGLRLLCAVTAQRPAASALALGFGGLHGRVAELVLAAAEERAPANPTWLLAVSTAVLCLAGFCLLEEGKDMLAGEPGLVRALVDVLGATVHPSLDVALVRLLGNFMFGRADCVAHAAQHGLVPLLPQLVDNPAVRVETCKLIRAFARWGGEPALACARLVPALCTHIQLDARLPDREEPCAQALYALASILHAVPGAGEELRERGQLHALVSVLMVTSLRVVSAAASAVAMACMNNPRNQAQAHSRGALGLLLRPLVNGRACPPEVASTLLETLLHLVRDSRENAEVLASDSRAVKGLVDLCRCGQDKVEQACTDLLRLLTNLASKSAAATFRSCKVVEALIRQPYVAASLDAMSSRLHLLRCFTMDGDYKGVCSRLARADVFQSLLEPPSLPSFDLLNVLRILHGLWAVAPQTRRTTALKTRLRETFAAAGAVAPACVHVTQFLKRCAPQFAC